MPIVTIPTVGKYGVITDVPSQELPIEAWSSASNMRFRNGAAERFRGETQIFTNPAVTPYWIQPYTNASRRYYIHAGLNKVYADDGTSRYDITGTAPTGGIDDRWTGGTLNGVHVMNNGIDAPTYWGGKTATPLATLPSWPANTRCNTLRPFKNYLIATGVTKNVGTTNDSYPHMIKWSKSAVPGSVPASWDQTDLTIDAGETDVAEEPSIVVDTLPMGDVNVIYKERAMFSMTFIGQPYVFQFQRLPGDIGALARGCVASTPVGHVVLCAGDVILHNGQGPQSIANAFLRRWLFTNIDSTNYKRSFVCTNPARDEVWICFPGLGQSACNLAVVWNWTDKTWAFRQLNSATYGASGQINYTSTNTWASDSDSWNNDVTAWNQDEYSPADARLLMCSAAPAISLIDTGGTFSGSAYVSTLERTGLAFNQPDRVKIIRSIYPRIDAAKGTQIQIQVGGSMDPEKAPTWSAPVTYTVGSTYKADAFANGRFLAVRFTSMDNQPWRIRSYDADIVMGGKF